MTAYGYDAAQCKVSGLTPDDIGVRCFAPNGTPVNTYFTVLLGS